MKTKNLTYLSGLLAALFLCANTAQAVVWGNCYPVDKNSVDVKLTGGKQITLQQLPTIAIRIDASDDTFSSVKSHTTFNGQDNLYHYKLDYLKEIETSFTTPVNNLTLIELEKVLGSPTPLKIGEISGTNWSVKFTEKGPISSERFISGEIAFVDQTGNISKLRLTNALYLCSNSLSKNNQGVDTCFQKDKGGCAVS